MKQITVLVAAAAVLAGCATGPTAKPTAVKRDHVLTGPYTHVAASDTPPKLLFAKDPVYPSAFRNSGIRGKAVIYFVVDATGTPVQVQYLDATDIAFAESAIKAVEQWRFKSATKNGIAVPACITVPIYFDR